jgi:hypothetical protein
MGKKSYQIMLQFEIELEKICENVFSSTFYNKLLKKRNSSKGHFQILFEKFKVKWKRKLDYQSVHF